MGLSNGERVSKTYWRLMWWRAGLVTLRDAMPKEWSSQRKTRDVVDGWIGRVDRLTGRLVAKRDSNGAYWILGSSDDNYQSCFDVLEVFNEPKEDHAEYDSFHAFETMSMVEFTRRLSEGTFESAERERARVVAAWWMAWQHIDAILYPVYRYDDDLFPPSFHDELCTLFGEIANRRYEIIAGNLDKNDVRDELLVEQAVLSKWKLFHFRLEDGDPWKKLTKKQLEQDDAYAKSQHKTRFAGDELIEQIGKMSLAQVADALKKHGEAKYRRKDDWDKKQRDDDAKKPQKIDGVLGPKMRTSDELHHIVDTSVDRAEAIAAGEELSTAHHTYANWEAIVDARLNPKKKNKARKTARTAKR